jgi:alpha/beta superfamily hydrolase
MRFPLNATMLVTALVAMLTTAAPVHGAGPDLAREDRWAEQVAPQVIVGDVVWLATRLRPRVLALYTRPSAPAKAAVIVVHGLGVNPDWGVIGVLRTALADRGFATLSVQMPVLAADAPSEGYADLYPEAGARLSAALAWLRERGYAKVAVVSHSLGAAMVDSWLAHAGAGSGVTGIAAWVPLGMAVPFSMRPRMPILDVVASSELPPVAASNPGRIAELPRDGCSRAVTVPGTDHFYAGAEARLVDAIAPFLTEVFDGRCGAAQQRQGQSRSSSIPAVARISRSRTAAHAGSAGTPSIRIASAPAASSARRFA